MQEIFFTILIIWLLFKIFGTNRSYSSFKSSVNKSNRNEKNGNNSENASVKKKSAVTTFLEKEGEYVDYEEVKK